MICEISDLSKIDMLFLTYTHKYIDKNIYN